MASVTIRYLIFGLICSLTKGAVGITEFYSAEEINAEFNKSLVHNLTIYDNIYVAGAINFTPNAFRKPAEVDSIFHVGTQSNEFYPAAFLNIEQKALFFKLSEKDRFDYMGAPKIEAITIGKLYYFEMWITQSSMKIDVNGQTIYNQEINAHLTDVNMSLYFGNPWNNAANVNISNFTFISSNDKIIPPTISRVQRTIKYHYTDEKESEIKQRKELGTSFDDIMNWDPLDIQRWLNDTDTVLLRKVNAIYDLADEHTDISGKDLVLMHDYKGYFNDFSGSLGRSGIIRLQKNLDLLFETMQAKNETPFNYTKHNDHIGFKKEWVTQQNQMIDAINMKQFFYFTFTINIDADDDSDEDWDSDTEGPTKFNVVRVGSGSIKYPSINFDSEEDKLHFQFQNFDEVTFPIERDTKYKIETYVSMNRYQVAIDKEIIFDASLYSGNHIISNNLPVFISSPWMDSSDKVTVSKLGMVTSQVNITYGDKMREYPFKYCLRTHTYHDDGTNEAFDGKWTPYGDYNNHTLFYKSYISGIKGSEWLYMFYYKQSWRIYLYPYNTTDEWNADKYFAICNIDNYNVAKCAKNFNFINGGLNRHFAMKAGPCKPKKKKTYEPEPDYYWPTTEVPESYPEYTDDEPVNVNHDSEDKANGEVKSPYFWPGVALFALIFGFCIYGVKKIKNPTDNDKKDSPEVIPFPGENQYRTTTFRGEDGLSMDYQNMTNADENGDIRELKTDNIAVDEENESEDEEDMIGITAVETDEFA